MDAGTCNASVQFGNYAYNMSGVTTEQPETRSNALQGESHLSNSYNGIEFESEHYDDYELQDVEIIAIDPNSFYAETASSSSESSDSSESDSEDDNQQEIHVSENVSFDALPFDGQPSTDDFDIITLNIDEDFPIDPQLDDDILFKNDHPFDLASYIGGESTSLLLSPISNVSARKRLMSISDFHHFENTPSKDLSRAPPPAVQTNAIHDKVVSKTPASNRRKRKNLSREFIESSDSDDEKETCTTQSSINNVVDDSKRNKLVKPRKDDDPIWNPTVDKRNAKLPKQPVCRTNETVDRNDSMDSNKVAKIAAPVQGNGLRTMLKQQLLSDRPVSKAKLLKTMSMPSGTIGKSIAPKVVPHPVKRLGVGRGKDIQITAKYYNVNETSDNNERDRSSKKDRFHQIYTDSDTDTESSESESDTNSDDSEIEVNSEPTPSFKDIMEEKKKPAQPANEIVKETKRENHFSKQSSSEELVKKPADCKTKLKTNVSRKPTVVDSSSMDSTDFAKALVTNAKAVIKTKPTVSKKSILEQQKRIIQSTLLLQNPAKFRMFATDKTNKLPSTAILSHAEAKVATCSPIQRKPEPVIVQQKPIEVQTVQPTVVKSFNDKQVKIECENEIDVVHDDPEDVKPDGLIAEENKVESSAKRKLNIQEYLKRKSLKTCHNGNAGARDGFSVNIKTEQIETQTDSNSGNKSAHDDECPNSGFAGNSMYEEIIIVSMGCNTDISIPEASFIQPFDTNSVKSTVLLSDIQTSVEKANSKISSMSLISSIQDVILKKSHSIEQNGKKEAGESDAPDGNGKEDEKPEHGENKVIMHLRKDRVRPTRVSTSIQTDPYFQFPPLERLAPLSKKQSMVAEKRMTSISRDRSNDLYFSHAENKNKVHRNYRGPSHLSESSYYSDEEEKPMQRRSRHSEFMENQTVRHRRVRRESSRYSSSKYDKYINRHRTISRSLSSSSDTSTTSTDSSSSSQSSSSSDTYVSSESVRSLNSYGGSSSKSYYGDDQRLYRKRTTSNNSKRSQFRQNNSKRSNSPEERRIVYVGRIEEETTKEELRRKFSVYGQVKLVTIHYKETKMKYGFVTFVRPCDAYTAIDDSSKNPAICHYDVSFGGRRAFCREKYFDLDNTGNPKYRDESISPQKTAPKDTDDSFDALLRKMKERKMQESKK